MNKAKVVVKVEGMTCANCAKGLEKSLSKQFDQVSVSFPLEQASFINPKNLSHQEIEAYFNKFGYSTDLDQQKKQKTWGEKQLVILSSIFTFPLFLHMFVGHDHWLNNFWVQLGLSIPVYTIGLIYFGKSAWNSIKSRVPNMDVLITIGSSAAFIYSVIGWFIADSPSEIHQYLFFETASMIITLVLLGNWLEKSSVQQTSTALKDLVALQNTKAIKIVDNQQLEVSSSELKIGDRLIVRKGDQIPIDGKLLSTSAQLNESAITGESLPINKHKNEELFGGTINTGDAFEMEVTKNNNNTVLSQIIQLVSKAQEAKPNIQRLGDKISAIFVPVVIGISLLTLVINLVVLNFDWTSAIMRAIAVLVISCPCAMGLATPTAVMSGVGRAAKSGILVKGGETLEELSKVDILVFDKTGTLTDGNFEITHLESFQLSDEEFLKIIYSLESLSSHPIAKSIVKSMQQTSYKVEAFKEVEGMGIEGIIDGNHYFLGRKQDSQPLEKDINLWCNDVWVGGFNIKDQLKPNTASLIQTMHGQGYHTVLLSGDKKRKCEFIQEELGITEVFSEQLPSDKIEVIKRLQQKGKVAMLGDGINDAPALAQADVGISFTDATQIAIQEAQVVLLKKQDLAPYLEAILLAKHTMKTIQQNLFWAFFYNVIAIPIAAIGMLSPMYAALAMAFSDVIVVGNSIRLKSKKLTA